MKIKKILLIVSLLILLIINFIQSIRRINHETLITLEAESATNISSPFELLNDPNGSDNQAIVTTMRSEDFEASLNYIFYAPVEGKYSFWANCLWPGGCSNSFILQINDGNRYVFGNNKNIYNQWHWVKGPVIKLNKGKHQLKIWNKEKFSLLDKMLLSLDLDYIPSNKEISPQN